MCYILTQDLGEKGHLTYIGRSATLFLEVYIDFKKICID